MLGNLALTAFIVVILGAILLTLLNNYRSNRAVENPEEFLLASKTLNQTSIVHLLLSSSFGVNALLYAVWLGYTVGMWGLVIQGAWALSFVLLTPFSQRVRSGTSLHDFLGKRFGRTTKLFAAICSLIGIMYLMGWEVGIGGASLQLFLKSENSAQSSYLSEILIVCAVFGTLAYTIIGGLKGNALVDQLLNFLKIVFIGALAYFVLRYFFTSPANSFQHALFPSFETMKQNLGIWGVITNIIFNLAWQFVDNSSWQSIIAGGETEINQTKWNLNLSGLSIFLTVGLLGTLIGVALVNTPNIDPNNILNRAIDILPVHKSIMTFGMFMVIAACIMSLLDGLFLACALTLVADIFQWDAESIWYGTNEKSKRSLLTIRVVLICIAIVAIWGIRFIFYLTGANLFDFVYIVILTQLALFGPVLLGLATDRKGNASWVGILVGLIVGFSSVLIGTVQNIKFLIDGAGTFALISSLFFAFILSTKHLKDAKENI